jgi:hypothetical protein
MNSWVGDEAHESEEANIEEHESDDDDEAVQIDGSESQTESGASHEASRADGAILADFESDEDLLSDESEATCSNFRFWLVAEVTVAPAGSESTGRAEPRGVRRVETGVGADVSCRREEDDDFEDEDEEETEV